MTSAEDFFKFDPPCCKNFQNPISQGGGVDFFLEQLRESSFNMTRGDEDIETWSLKF